MNFIYAFVATLESETEEGGKQRVTLDGDLSHNDTDAFAKELEGAFPGSKVTSMTITKKENL